MASLCSSAPIHVFIRFFIFSPFFHVICCTVLQGETCWDLSLGTSLCNLQFRKYDVACVRLRLHSVHVQYSTSAARVIMLRLILLACTLKINCITCNCTVIRGRAQYVLYLQEHIVCTASICT